MRLVLVGPSVDYVSGSLLRAFNLWCSLRCLRNVEVVYVPVRSVVCLVFYLHVLLSCDVVFVSGVGPWVGVVVVFLRRLVGRPVIVDVHGFEWFEVLMTGVGNVFFRVFVFMCEFFAYTYSTAVVAASKWLLLMLSRCFRVKYGFVVPNAVTPMFEEAVGKLSFYDQCFLRRFVLQKVFEDMSVRIPDGLVLLAAPLPYVFKSNELAYKVLVRLSGRLPSNVVVVVTGMPKRVSKGIVSVGYLPFLTYIILILTSDGVVLPYPDNAVCGGVRNKVLEAGYCGKPVIATETTMLHMNVTPRKHYVPFSEMLALMEKSNPKLEREAVEYWRKVAVNLQRLVLNGYSFARFKVHMLQTFKLIIESLKR